MIGRMPIRIEDERTEGVMRKLAKLTGETLTEAVRIAVEERYERLRRDRFGRSLSDELNEIALRCARRKPVSNLTSEEILGYDEAGIPTR
jgi:antitoxin VapB